MVNLFSFYLKDHVKKFESKQTSQTIKLKVGCVCSNPTQRGPWVEFSNYNMVNLSSFDVSDDVKKFESKRQSQALKLEIWGVSLNPPGGALGQKFEILIR